MKIKKLAGNRVVAIGWGHALTMRRNANGTYTIERLLVVK